MQLHSSSLTCQVFLIHFCGALFLLGALAKWQLMNEANSPAYFGGQELPDQSA